MKIIFAGSPEFAVPSLNALLNSEHKICAVYTQPDRPAGRGLKLTPSPVKTLALANNLEIYQPNSLRDEENISQIKKLNADILIDVAFGLLLIPTVLNLPRYGCINIHPSLLPRWRGAAPIQRAILAGDKETGITIMQMNEGLDTGDILLQARFPIENTDTTDSLSKKLAEEGAMLLLKTLEKIENGTIEPVKQKDSASTYANKITKEEALLDWNLTAEELDRMVRAYNPFPIAYININDLTVRIWEAIPLQIDLNDFSPGTIINVSKQGIDIATTKGALRLKKIQFPGKKPISIVDAVNAYGQYFNKGSKLL